MIRLLVYFSIIYFAIKLVRAIISPVKNYKRTNNNSYEEMVEDPYCGTFIPRSSALEKKSGGKRIYFCSRECWQKYKEKGNG